MSTTPSLGQLIENFNKFKEALEYGSFDPSQPLLDAPQFIKDLADEVRLLDKATKKAYELGSPEADDLDAKLASKTEELENALSELEGDELVGSDEEKHTDWGTDALMRQFASIFHYYINNIPYQGLKLSLEKLMEHLRYFAEGFGWSLGGFKKDTTDAQLYDAAEDSYERMTYLKRKSLNRLAGA